MRKGSIGLELMEFQKQEEKKTPKRNTRDACRVDDILWGIK